MSDPKSPRDWLLGRHVRATPQLDALRRGALPQRAASWREVAAELFRPNRIIWQALASAWLLLVALHLVTRISRQPRPIEPSPSGAVAQWLTHLKTNETFAQIDRHP